MSTNDRSPRDNANQRSLFLRPAGVWQRRGHNQGTSNPLQQKRGRPHPERDTKQRHQFRYSSTMWELWLCTTSTSNAKMLWFPGVGPRGPSRRRRGTRKGVPRAPFCEVRANNHLTRGVRPFFERLACCEIVYCRGGRGDRDGSGAQVLHARYRDDLDVNPGATGLGYRLRSGRVAEDYEQLL